MLPKTAADAQWPPAGRQSSRLVSAAAALHPIRPVLRLVLTGLAGGVLEVTGGLAVGHGTAYGFMLQLNLLRVSSAWLRSKVPLLIIIAPEPRLLRGATPTSPGLDTSAPVSFFRC